MPEASERPPIADAPLSVVLLMPELTVHRADVVRAWADYLCAMNHPHELLVVYHGDFNAVAERVDDDLATGFSTKYIKQDMPGIGAGLRAGLAAASCPLVFYTECSNSYTPGDLVKLLEVIDHVDLVSGFREVATGSSARPGSDRLYRLMLRLIFGLRLKDVDCSFKLFRRSIFARIPIQSNGGFAHAEVMAKANFLGCLIGEVGVAYTPKGDIHLDATARRQRRHEAMRVFRRPDFGPAELTATT